MGLFNFIYKLTNILSNKRKIKVFFIIAIIILLLFCWSRGAFASTPQDDLTIMNYELILQQTFTNYIRYWAKTKPSSYSDSLLNTVLSRIMYNSIYCIAPNGDPNNELWVYTYLPNSTYYQNNPNLFSTPGTWSLGLNSGTEIDCMLGSFTPNSFIRFDISSGAMQLVYTTSNLSSFYMPSACYMVRSTNLDDLLKDYGMYSAVTPTYNTNDEELQALTQSGFQNEVNAINNATSAINDVNSSVEDVNQSVMDMIDTITAPYVNVSQEQLPTQSVTDTTEQPLNTLFDYIKDAFTGEPTGFSLPMPFVRW